MSWCGRFEGGWDGPCKLNVVVAVVFSIFCLLVAGSQARRLRILGARQLEQNKVPQAISLVLLSIYALCACLHLAWLVTDIVLKETAKFQIFTEAFFSAAWIAVLVSLTCGTTYLPA